MRILISTENYHRIGGTETYVHTIAEQLLRLGHQVRIYSPHLGDMAQLTRGVGVDVVSQPQDLDEPDDVVIAQDAATSYELAGRWPEVPQVYVCHSTMYDVQQPPLVTGTVQAVVVMSERMAKRAAALDADLRLVRMRQPIDTERLSPRGEPSMKPRRALLLGNYLEGDARQLLVDTWSEQGVEVVQVGTATRPTLQPQDDIAAADIVVGKGRAVLDAMACGRPAYVYDVLGADGWVTAETYDAIEADAIAGHAFPRVSDAEQLRADLAAYDPGMGRLGRQLVQKHHEARMHATDLATLCLGLAPEVPRGADYSRELARQVRLRWRAEVEVMSLQTSLRQAALDLDEERRRRRAAERERDKARARGRRMTAKQDALKKEPWVRVGAALRLVKPR